MLITSTIQSFTISASKNDLLEYAIFCAKEETSLCCNLLVRVHCWCFNCIDFQLLCYKLLANVTSSATNCLLIFYSLITDHIWLQIKYTTFDGPVCLEKSFSAHFWLKARHSVSTMHLFTLIMMVFSHFLANYDSYKLNYYCFQSTES